MSSRPAAACILGILLLGPGGPGWAQDDPRVAADIARRLVCYCGTCSNQTIQDCTCGTAGQAREEIRRRLRDGQSPAAIIASFTDRFGEQILIAPTKEGFNLVAWITPFAVLLAAGFGLFVALRRWNLATASAGAPSPSPAAPPAGSEDRRLLEKLERELEEFES